MTMSGYRDEYRSKSFRLKVTVYLGSIEYLEAEKNGVFWTFKSAIFPSTSKSGAVGESDLAGLISALIFNSFVQISTNWYSNSSPCCNHQTLSSVLC